MGSTTDIRGILTAFSPSLDFFAITTGDGHVKLWDTDTLSSIVNSRGATLQPLLQLSGCLQLVTSQIDKASQTISDSVHDHQMEESGDEDEEDEYSHDEGDDESEISSDDES